MFDQPPSTPAGVGPQLDLGSGRLEPRVDGCEFLAPSAIVVGDVRLAHATSVWYGAVLRGDAGRIVIGQGTNVQDCAVLHGETVVGSGVVIGHGAKVHGCWVGTGVLVGIQAAILSRARVGSGAIVAAGSVVLEGFEVPRNTLVAGVPARVVRETTAEERAGIAMGCEVYIGLARAHRQAWHMRGVAE